NAIVGGAAATLVWLLVYFKLLRAKPDLEAACVIFVCALVFGLIAAAITGIWGRWSLLPVFGSCLGILVASFSYFGRRGESVLPSEKGASRLRKKGFLGSKAAQSAERSNAESMTCRC